ncbi:HEAT repeat domain-containing protein [Flammeovirgaceae bacterium SG7u.111]|nr:HEAT repeat domain-containing protein [Flammeovirgaceae bacterium SG7u.132]WPO34245.1 HEAT repeat domain-containing protein [Flammeovirgaceae bacterium SG7u.111]
MSIGKMTKDEFINIIREGSVDKKHQVIQDADPTFFDDTLFNILVSQLENADYRVRFSALYYLIDKFSKELSEPTDELANLMVKLLKDKAIVIDRAAWALSIMGEIGLNKLFKNAHTKDSKLRRNVIWAIGRNTNLNLKKEKAIQILMEGIQDKNEEIRFTSMCSLIDISPLRNDDYYMIKGYDFTEVYKKMKATAKYFMESDNESHRDFGKRYFIWIEEEKK